MSQRGRDVLAQALRQELVGPRGKEAEVLIGDPLWTYLCGAIYPRNFRPLDGEIDESDDPLQLTSKFYPSALGASVLVKQGSTVEVLAKFARYTPGEEKSSWQRSPSMLSASIASAALGEHSRVSDGDVELVLQTRVVSASVGDVVLITAMLVNRQDGSHLSGRDASKATLFQARIEIRNSAGFEIMREAQFSESFGNSEALLGSEESDLSFLYRGVSPLAHGHGIAVDWDQEKKMVWTESIPMVLVHSLRADPPRFSNAPLTLSQLMGSSRQQSLEVIIRDYEVWIRGLEEHLKVFLGQSNTAEPSKRIIERQRDCLRRMRSGIEVLASNAAMSESWDLAVASMHKQFSRPAVQSEGRLVGEPAFKAFQIGFALLVIPGIGDPSTADSSRELVDLLWFPTGGGKTEAYLFIALMEIFSRRLLKPEDSGAVALSRYTYRMLAFDQFSRAASAICGAEILRREHAMLKQGSPFSVGLWIGGSQTPNHLVHVDSAPIDGALPWRERWMDPSNVKGIAFPVITCPWCATALKFGPEYLSVISDDMKIWCPSSKCEFSKSSSLFGLPIAVVDEQLYRHPPAMLVATVDKLAGVATWPANDGPDLLRGSGQNGGVSLLIFDELHLLNGPLGTLAALNEIIIEEIIRSTTPSRRSPKVIASTATIRTAGDQARSLLGRGLHTFPVQSDDPDESFWATRDDRSGTARLYTGAMTSGSTWQALYVYAQTALMRAVLDLPQEERNPYWTSVVYAQTLREHGRAVGLLGSDVRNRLQQFPAVDAKGIEVEPRNLSNIRELRGDKIGGRLPEELRQLRVNYLSEYGDAVDAVVTTNLIQVGVDVQRLGLMLFLGQPKGTAEYIQASSRVGRSADSPGLIFTLFQHTRPRDRSHYETFRSYHDALYRSVEPISITPFTTAALERALRSTIAAVGRHGVSREYSSYEKAGAAGRDQEHIEKIKQLLLQAAAARTLDSRAPDELVSLQSRLLSEWSTRAEQHDLIWIDKNGQHKVQKKLLRPRYDSGDPSEWPMDYSLRSVEPDIEVVLDGTVLENQP